MIHIPDDVISKTGKLLAPWIVISRRKGDIDDAMLSFSFIFGLVLLI